MFNQIMPLFIIFVVRFPPANLTLPDLGCPEDCDCHYFRINWVTDCSESNLTSIPYEGLSLNVYILNMNGNNVTDIEPFPENIKLRSLRMANNQLSTLKRESFKGLHFLLDADFSGNKIQYIDPNAFKDVTGLITLELQNNPLDHVDGPFLISRSLLYLDLSYCQLRKPSHFFFSNSTALNRLDLSGNPITSLTSGVLDPLYSLEYLQLNNCNLTHIHDKAFANMTNLKNLELSINYLTDVNWKVVVGSITRLELLNLRNSHINNLPGDLFENNTYLTTLILSENVLKDVDISNTLGINLRYLETLDLSNCHIMGPLSEYAFGNATRLRNLVLTGNHLSASDLTVALSPLVRLHKLSLRNCFLTRLPSDTFHRFPHLEELDISHNPLNDAFTELLSPLTSLEYLDMGFSNLSYVAKNTFSKMTHLKHLILSGNLLTELESGLFHNLTHLEVLELNSCGLSHPPDATVFVENRTYTDLQELRLAGNPLEVSEFEALLPPQLARLKTVDMSNCNLKRLPDVAFNWTRNIVTLRLSGNPLGSDVGQESQFLFLKNLRDLENLDISFCNYSSINPKYLENNVNLSSLRLVGNPWKCDCNVTEMWEWALDNTNDVGALVGSTTQPADVTAGGSKRKKGLLCSVEHTPTRNSSSSLVTDSLYRTWARYVKESNCPKSRKPESIAYTAFIGASDVRSLLHYINETPPNWITVLSCIAVVVLMCTVIGTGLALLFRKIKTEQRQISSNPVIKSVDSESQKYATEIELLEQYLQRHRLQNEHPDFHSHKSF